ncbi:hypothetical protein G7Z17_g7671 [Cylindrodendrum hubeiense]|uniref:NACHT domain-containing protein n=1 Tax=Cylindrodendrum hubeiense TaxID=595255 RepID=A0A9P5L763_9HYPO|nr:hypothetical protein G7Z17_g7671 [Cylindrodendrum hubeiense]
MKQRPATTADLIQRLTNLHSQRARDKAAEKQQDSRQQLSSSERHERRRDEKEAEALAALSNSMVQTFIDHHDRLYAVEAAALAPYIDTEKYESLFDAFVRAIGKGSADGEIPDAKIMVSFNAALQCSQISLVGPALPLGHVISSLVVRLKLACSTSDKSIQYQLLCTLSAVLDTMNEVKSTVLSDENVVVPLQLLLGGLIDDDELLLSQAAQYANEALRGIQSDVSPWMKLGDSAYKTLKAAADIASSVTTMNPAKLLSGLEGLGSVVDLIKDIGKIIEEVEPVVEKITTLISEGSKTLGDAKNLIKPSSWYLALRYTNLMIRARNHGMLESLLKSPDFSAAKNEDFLCGLCAQLEQAIHENGKDDPVVKVLDKFLVEHGRTSTSSRVQEWILLTTQPVANSTKPKVSWTRRLGAKLNIGSSKKYLASVRYQKIRHEPPGNKLLNATWQNCREAQVFFADERIREKYTNETHTRLKVERLGTGSGLSMEQCYINLAISKEVGDGMEPDEPSQFSLQRRLAIWEPKKETRVSLPDIFPQTSPIGKPEHKRVLISGQAGVGKSTLCKRIVYECIYNGMWSDKIDRVIWLPLRQLKGDDIKDYTIKTLLEKQYFQDEKLLADALFENFEQDPNKTLFILDGLDEVYDEVSDKNSELLMSLLNEPKHRVIITTRPYAFNKDLLKPPDQSFETIGFYPDQVKQYIEAVIIDKAAAAKIQDFIGSHPVVEGLARIPVQLDALCYTFEAQAFDPTRIPQTMTELYSAIEQAIWKKDVVHLEKSRGNSKPIGMSDAWNSNASDVESLVRGEINMLQALAFDGLCDNRQEFDSTYQDQFWRQHELLIKHLPQAKSKAWSSDMGELSFLRTSGDGPVANRSYHFLHLTYQEYFAAHYLVQHWPNGTLPRKDKDITVEEFIGREKYNPRFDIVWRFVAGLLHKRGDVEKFFAIIQAKPYDLLGPAHQRLVMHCLAEVSKGQETPKLIELRRGLENELQQWLVCECSPLGYSRLATELEFPESILLDSLRGTSESLRKCILMSLGNRSTISPEIVKYLTGDLAKEASAASKAEALSVFAAHSNAFPRQMLHLAVSLLQDADRKIRHFAEMILSPPADLPDDIVEELVAFLETPKGDISLVAAGILTGHPALPEDSLLKIASTLQHLNGDLCSQVAQIFESQSFLSEKIIHEVLTLLQDPEESSSYHLERAVIKQPNRSRETEKDLLAMLTHPVEAVQNSAATLLSSQPGRLDLLEEIVSILECDPDIESSAVEDSLSDQEALPTEILQKLLTLLKDSHPNIRISASTILGNHSGFPPAIVKDLVALLDDPDRQENAMGALKKQSSLSEQTLQKVIQRRLGNRSRNCAEQSILENQHVLPPTILEQLLNWLKSPDLGRRNAAKDILSKKPHLVDKMVEKVAELLDDTDKQIQADVAFILSKQPALPENVLSKMVALLTDPSDRVKSFAVEAVKSQIDIQPGIQSQIMNLLGHPNPYIQLSVENALVGKKSAPSADILEEVADLLNSPDEKHRASARSILGNQPVPLSGRVLQKVAALLKDPKWQIRASAANILSTQESALPQNISEELMAKLEDLDANVVAEILKQQPTLSEPVIQRLGAMLMHPKEEFWSPAATILNEQLAISDERFTSFLAEIGSQAFAKFIMGVQRNIPLAPIRDAIREARISLGVPSQDLDSVL